MCQHHLRAHEGGKGITLRRYIAELCSQHDNQIGLAQEVHLRWRIAQAHVSGIEAMGIRQQILTPERDNCRELPSLHESQQRCPPFVVFKFRPGDEQRPYTFCKMTAQDTNLLRTGGATNWRLRSHRFGGNRCCQDIFRKGENHRPADTRGGGL